MSTQTAMPTTAEDARFALDRRALRRARARTAKTAANDAVLEQELCERMAERLAYIKYQPATILDAGSGNGYATRRLRAIYPDASIVALDLCHELLVARSQSAPWWRRGRTWHKPAKNNAVCADLEQIPLKSGSVQMVWSNCALFWHDPVLAIRELARVLAPGGFLMLSTLGPDTLKELRAAFAAIDSYAHVNRFMDMHDLGDILVHEGFADPVIDMELIRYTYANVRELLRDLQGAGAQNVNRGRRAGLMGRRALSDLAKSYELQRHAGMLPATFEVIYAHGWRGPDRRNAGQAQQVIQFDRLKQPPRG